MLFSTELRQAPDIWEGQVLRASRALKPTSADEPARLSPLLFYHLDRTTISPEATVTRLSVFTHLVHRLARGELPDHTCPLLYASKSISIHPRHDKSRPIAMSQAFHRLVTKALLSAAIGDNSNRLLREHLPSSVPSGMDAIAHGFRMPMRRFNRDCNYIAVCADI